MESSRARIYRVGEIEIDVSLGCLRRSGEEVRLRARTMQVLLYLVEQRQRLVTRDELFARFWPDTAVTDEALAQCLVDIRRAFGDSFREPRIIRTVPKLGYRFIAEVEEIAVGEPVELRTGGGTSAVASHVIFEEETTTEIELVEETSPHHDHPARLQLPAPRSRFPRPFSIAVVAAVSIGGIAAVGWWIAIPRRSPPVEIALPAVPGKQPVIVMYLDNQSNNRDLEWLRAGLADMLIANLSRASQLAVLSRQELQQVIERTGHGRGRTIDLAGALDVARASRAATVMLGSFASFGTTVRVSVQLHDAGTGRLRAAESATAETPEQIPRQMDVLAARLASHLGAVVTPNDTRTPALPVMTNDLEAYRHYSLGVDRAIAFETPVAIQFLERAIAIDPEFAMAHARIGYAYAVTGFEVERGRPYLERAFRLADRLTEKDRLLITAWYAIANLDYAGAIAAMHHIIASYPAETDAYLRLGLLLRGEDRPDEAIQIVERGLALVPDSSVAMKELGILYLERGDQARAFSWLTKAASAAPQDTDAQLRLGHALRWVGRYDEAAASYRRALALNPSYQVSASLSLGNVYVDLGRYRDAITQYNRQATQARSPAACAAGPRYTASVYLRLGDLDRAQRLMDESMKCDPTAYWNAVVIARLRGQHEKAARLMERVDIDPPPDRGLRQVRRFQARERGMRALWSGRADEAVEYFKQALRHRPLIANIETLEDCLANAYLELGRLDEAIAEYQRVLRTNPNHALSRYRLGLAFERSRKRDEARAEFQRFLDIWKDADANIPELVDAKARLAAM